MRKIAEGLTAADKMRLGRDPTIPRPFEHSPAPGACPMCAGRRKVMESIDDERFPVPVACDRCTMFCRECKRRVPKPHNCKGASK